MRMLARFDDRARIVGIIWIGILLTVLQILTGELFTFVIAVVLITAPTLNWRAFMKLRRRRLDRAALGLPQILSLRTAYYSSMFLATASTLLAAVGLFIIGRAMEIFGPIPRELFLILLSYPLVLISGPAIEWLILIDALESEG